MNLSYNISGHLGQYLSKIEKLRIEILTHPLTPKSELKLKWDAQLERTIWSLAISENPISKSDITKILSYHYLSPKKKLDKNQKDVIASRNIFSYLKENWMAAKTPVSITAIKNIYDIACSPFYGPRSGLTEYSEKRISTLLTYLQRGEDHPIIQAGLIQPEIIAITPFDNGNGRLGRIMSYLYLYKNGWDIREMLVLEEFYKRDLITYRRMLDTAKIRGNMTVWLEYFAYCLGSSLEKQLGIIKNLKFQEGTPASFWKLNVRQKEIVSRLETPGEKITNKGVQKLFNVSQITASRDLAKLANLGLLLAHGKGRSVFYTRV